MGFSSQEYGAHRARFITPTMVAANAILLPHAYNAILVGYVAISRALWA